MPIKTISSAIKTGLTGLLTLTSILALTACGPGQAGTSAKAAKPVTMTDCNGLHHSRPDIVDVVCESDAITARSLNWSGWGSAVATAKGTAVVDLCAFTDCHTGSYGSFPIVVIASKIVTCGKGTSKGTGTGSGPSKQRYSRLQYVFVGHDPFASLPKNLGIANSLFGSHRPGPPHNDTVSLPC